ncbi:MAG TPA: amino acid adenylation domain-containing protein [Candidatus Angelobacter sp.]
MGSHSEEHRVSTSDQVRSAQQVSTAKQLLLQKWMAGKSQQKQTIPNRSRSGSAPLSFAQQRLWFLDQLVPGSTAYNVAFGARISGLLDVAAAHKAFNEIVRRHQALRTTFQSQDGVSVQIIHEPFPLDLQLIELASIPESQRNAHIEQIAKDEVAKPFDLSCLPLLRITLLRLAEDQYVVIGTAHHIVFDGWSASVFFKEFLGCYRAFRDGQQPVLPQLQVQYTDFAEWQTNWLSGERLESQLGYWKKQMSGELPMLQLPIDKSRPSVYSFKGTSFSFAFNKALTAPARQLCQSAGATSFMLVLGALSVWLHQYSGQDDILIGCPIANRQYRELEDLIGCFANTLVMRTNLAGDPDFRQILQIVRDNTLNAYANQDLPFEKLVNELQPDRDMSRNPLFQIMLNFDTVRGPQIMELPGLTITAFELGQATAKFDLWLTIAEQPDGFTALLEYNTDLFSDAMAQRMAGHLKRVLEQVVTNPDCPISSLSLLTNEEYRQVTIEWNDTRMLFDLEHPLHFLFEEQVRKSPAAPACIFEGTVLSYAELNQRANRVADYLIKHNAAGSIVGIMAHRSLEIVVGLLGILKSGAAYLPLDPEYPLERLRFMLEDSQVPVVLVQRNVAELLDGFKLKLPVLEEMSLNRELSELNPKCEITSDHLAYAIYTSGSTGKPKAGMNSHRGICNRLLWMQDAYRLDSSDRVLQKTPFSFDVSVWEFFWPLLAGAAIVVARPGGHKDPEYLVCVIRNEKITTLHFVPSMLQPFLETPDLGSCTSLRRVICSGEVLPPESAKRFTTLFPGVRLYNLYGPTEAAVDVTAWDCGQEMDRTTVPIGRPIANIQIYVLDRSQKPVPVGVPGELYIGGVGVGRGYLNRPALTASKFVPDCFSIDGGARLYRTGDLVRWLPGGVLEFLDRVDNQVKIRGYRIELGEIEVRLREYSAVKDAVVLAREDRTGTKQLVAYIVAGPQAETLGRELNADHVQQWRSVFDETYQQPLEIQTSGGHNFAGWNSSYTGNQIDAGEMQEWLDGTIKRILAFKPARVLELGCGTGLLLLAIAPHCKQYVGTDISQRGLQYIRSVIKDKPEYSGVELKRQPAVDVVEGFPNSFDVVILNSVIQYFPDEEYLTQVLATAEIMVRDGGHIFLGDVRHGGLMEPFHLSVEMSRVDGSFSVEALRQCVLARIQQEQELAVDPAFFYALPARMGAVTGAEIWLRQGKNSNEMTRFRYDAILEVRGVPPRPAPIAWEDWQQTELQWDQWREYLCAAQPQTAALTRVPNSRVISETHLSQMLADSSQRNIKVEELQSNAEAQTAVGIDPEAFWDLGEKLGYQVKVGLRRGDMPGQFSVLMEHQAQDDSGHWNMRFDDEIAAADSSLQYTNLPVREKMLQSLVFKLRCYLRDRLPEFMVPSQFVFLETLPLNANGKMDRDALPMPAYDRFLASAFVPPKTPLQEMLAGTWKEVLGIEQIGMADNFFDLGGDSIRALRVIALIQKAGLNLTAQKIFKHQTIGELAEIIEGQQLLQQEPADTSPLLKGSKPARTQTHDKIALDLSDGGKDFPLANLDRPDLMAHLGEDCDIEDALPLSALAEEMLVQHLASEDSAINLVQRVDFFQQKFVVPLYDQALQLLAKRNPILRTSFLWKGLERPLQIFHRNVRIPLVYEDWRDVPESEVEPRLNNYLKRDSIRGLDLTRPPQLRVFLAQTASDAFYTVLSFNYMCMEGWSLSLLTAEHAALYASLERNVPHEERPKAAYRDYIAWLIRQDLTKTKLFWMEELRGAEMPTPLVKKVPGNMQKAGMDFARIERVLSATVTQGVRELARSRRLTESVVFQAAWALLVSRYCGTEDVVLGVAMTGRSAGFDNIQQMTGQTLNFLPVRLQVEPEIEFLIWLSRVQQKQVELIPYEHLRVQQLRAWLQLPPDSLLFESIFYFQNLSGPVNDGSMGLFYAKTAYPLRIDVFPRSTHLGTQVYTSYHLKYFNELTITRILDDYEQLLAAVLCDPLQKNKELVELTSPSKVESLEAGSPCSSQLSTASHV